VGRKQTTRSSFFSKRKGHKMANKKLTFEKKNDSGRMVLLIKGIIDEEAELKKVFSELRMPIIFNMEGVQMINSAGVREWVTAISKIPPETPYILERCSPQIVEQLNYVSTFLGHGQVASFFAPYFCHKCKTESMILLDVKSLQKKGTRKAPPQKCFK